MYWPAHPGKYFFKKTSNIIQADPITSVNIVFIGVNVSPKF